MKFSLYVQKNATLLCHYISKQKKHQAQQKQVHMYLDEKGKKRTNYRLMSYFSVQPNFVQNLFRPDGSRAKKLQKERRNNCRNKSGLLSVRHYVAPASRASSLATLCYIHCTTLPEPCFFFQLFGNWSFCNLYRNCTKTSLKIRTKMSYGKDLRNV